MNQLLLLLQLVSVSIDVTTENTHDNCYVFDEEREKRKVIHALGDYILKSDLSNDDKVNRMLMLSGKYKYGIGVKKNLNKSISILNLIEDSLILTKPRILGAKYHQIGSFLYACNDNINSLLYLKKASEAGHIKSTFLYPYLAYNDKRYYLSLPDYLKNITYSIEQGSNFSVFEYLYLSKKHNVLLQNESLYKKISNSSLIEDCYLYDFHRTGKGVNGLVVDWEIKKKIFQDYWPNYYYYCSNK